MREPLSDCGQILNKLLVQMCEPHILLKGLDGNRFNQSVRTVFQDYRKIA